MIKPFEMPFNNLTFRVEKPTNDGPVDKHVGTSAKDIDQIRVKNSAKYSPVKLSSKPGYVELATASTDRVIGVLMESFSQPNAEHQVMIEGVVKMEASQPIAPGDLVKAATANTTQGSKNTKRTRIAKVTPATDGGTGVQPHHYTLGIALQKASAEGDWISVLIGTVSGVIRQ
ncbi:MAG: hypothetical protein ACRCX2_30140 [Paraclostridium sp.]